MKKVFIAIFAGFVLMLSGCAVPLVPAQTPTQILAQINTQVCPVLIADGPIFLTLPGLTAANTAALTQVNKDVATVCVAGASLNAATLQTLASSSLPIALSIVQALPAFSQQTAIVNGITAAQLLLPVIIAQVNAATAASTTTPSTAPVVVAATPAAA